VISSGGYWYWRRDEGLDELDKLAVSWCWKLAEPTLGYWPKLDYL